MGNVQEFKIYPIGIPDEDKMKLQRVFRLSSGSVRQYVLTDDMESSSNKLILVNSDDRESVAYWCKYFLSANKKPEVPTVFVGRRKVKGDHIYNLRLPFVATQVLSVLDTMTVKELNYIPELKVGDVPDETGLSQSMLESMVDSELTGQQLFTALVVDDSQPVRKQLEIELKILGARVQLSESGEQAIELCRDNKYDIIFLDVVMPGIDGYEVCKHLKKSNYSKNTPVIMLTGKSSPISKVKGSLSGCDSYLTKPLEREQFQHVAGKYLATIKQAL